MTGKTVHDFADVPPADRSVTDYDRRHLTLYARLLDANADGATLHEIAKILFGIDADEDPDLARKLHDGHLDRARWMTENGYRSLLPPQAG